MVTNNGSSSSGKGTTTGGATGHQRRPIPVPSGNVIDPRVKKLVNLLGKTNYRLDRDDADVWKEFEKVEPQGGWEDIISDDGLKRAHIPRLWGKVDRVKPPLPVLSGEWRVRSWQGSEGPLNQFLKLLGFMKDKDVRMTIDGSHSKYTATFGDKVYTALSPIPDNMQPCHLAFKNGDMQDDQIILRICIANANVLVGRMQKGSKIPSNDKEELKITLAELVLVKVDIVNKDDKVNKGSKVNKDNKVKSRQSQRGK